jgi:hypothetical protein
MEIFGTSGTIDYTTPELGELAEQYGIVNGTNRILAFDCPWIQGRPDTPDTVGPKSHCTGGMFVIVQVTTEGVQVATDEGAPSSSSSSLCSPFFAFASLVAFVFGGALSDNIM